MYIHTLCRIFLYWTAVRQFYNAQHMMCIQWATIMCGMARWGVTWHWPDITWHIMCIIGTPCVTEWYISSTVLWQVVTPHTTCNVWLSGDHHVIRSYRSVGDETFMRAFETATLGYEEWTHEVCSHNLPLPLRCFLPVPGSCQDGMELSHPARQRESNTHHQVSHLSIHRHIFKVSNVSRKGVQYYIDQNYGKVKNVYNETITIFFIHMVDTAIQQVGCMSHDYQVIYTGVLWVMMSLWHHYSVREVPIHLRNFWQ